MHLHHEKIEIKHTENKTHFSCSFKFVSKLINNFFVSPRILTKIINLLAPEFYI